MHEPFRQTRSLILRVAGGLRLPPRARSSHLPRLAAIAVLGLGTLGAFGATSVVGGCTVSKSCTLLACGNEGVHVDFRYKDPGSYVVDVTVDGTKTTCTATIPLAKVSTSSDACVAAGIYLNEVGSELPVAEQSIGGLVIASMTAKSVTLRISRDGMVLKEDTLAPSYVVTPGPNGPDCEPKECKGAKLTLP